MKIDDAIIDKVLNNEASAEEAGKVAMVSFSLIIGITFNSNRRFNVL